MAGAAKHLRDIALLPGMATLVIPVLLVRATGGPWAFADVAAWAGWAGWARTLSVALGAALLAAGVGLFVWTVSLFARFGRGTLAPWEPTQQLVVRGPYRHVRNPMITAVTTVLLAEALLFGAPVLLAWAAAFFGVNALWIPRYEERSLERRFGGSYRAYSANVPRWLPRRTAWDPAARTECSRGAER
jgi:protein-S-isoprenylcysteine O-methyltransferase Ste14